VGKCKDCMAWNNGECADVDYVYENEKVEMDNFGIFADADDDQGLVWGLKTGPDFGCVKFKSKK
jgi:hypothetical protein